MMMDRRPAAPSAVLERAASEFEAWRPRLFGVAYRILGSVPEAEDIVQEAWLRWQATDRTVVHDPPAFLATTASRLAINVAQSARARREAYVGPWLADAAVSGADPALGAERSEGLEHAALLLLERLTSTERAAFVLREAFGYPYGEIASLLRLGEANARQLVSRARKRLESQRRQPVQASEHRCLVDALLVAFQKGDLTTLENLLTMPAARLPAASQATRVARIRSTGRKRAA